MLVSSFCASRPRDATRRMSATELVCAAPSQQRLRRSSVAAALRASAHHERSTGQSKKQPVGKICQKQGDTATTTQPCFFELFSLKSLGHSPAPEFFFLGY